MMYSRCLLQLFLFFNVFFVESSALDCSNIPTSDGYANLTLTLTREESNPLKCTFQVPKVYHYAIPSINIEGRLTGSNSITIRQNTTIAGMQEIYVFGDSVTYHISLDLVPSFFEIEFNVPNNTENDWFNIDITFVDFKPERLWLSWSQSLLSVKKSSEFLQNKYYYLSDANFLEFVSYEKTISTYYAQQFYLYDDMKFLGTLYDFWNNLDPSSGTFPISGIVNVNPEIGDYFSVICGKTELAGFNYTTRMTTDNFQSLESNHTKVIYELRPKTSQPLNFRSLSVIGSGNVSIYAGCAVMPDPQYYTIAVLNEHNFANFEDLSVYGTCLTYVLSNVQASWTQGFYDQKPTITPRQGQQGVIISYHYPYPESSMYTVTNTINPVDQANTLSVTYTSWNSDNVVITTTDKAQSLSDSSSTTVMSLSYQTISCNVIDKGFLVQYTVNSAKLESFGWILAMIWVKLIIDN